MEKEAKSNNNNNIFEKEIDELGNEIVKVIIKRKRNKIKQNNININEEKEKEKEEKIKDLNNIVPTIKNNEENINNNILEKKILNNNNINNEQKEEFNLDSFNNFVNQNKNIKGSSNNNKQLTSRLKPHLKLKLNLGLGLKKQENLKINGPMPSNNNNNNIQDDNIKNNENKINNNNDINDDNNIQNININNISEEAENLKKSLEQNSNLNIQEIKDNTNIESSFLLKQKFNKINESQISYEGSSIINQFKKTNKKSKFKLNLYDLEIITLLGVGSSGEVYLVQDSKTKKKLALKKVKYTEDEKTNNQIETEVKLSKFLKHENIIRIYATYFFENNIHFVMEYMDKGTIEDLIKKKKIIPEKYVGMITYQILKGMIFCQKERKIIHRDLKPSNILVNSKGKIKISDFGVSTIVEGSWAQRKTMTGTIKYMAPERIESELYYINCDVWSLGLIVMECILGYYPYNIYNNNKTPGYWEVREIIEKNPVPQLDKKKYSLELIDFTNKCLIKDPKERPTPAKLMDHPFIEKYNKLSCDELAFWLNSDNK